MHTRGVKVAIIGAGNIGTDLMMKIQRLDSMEVSHMVGIDPSSRGLARARELGVSAIDQGLANGVKRLGNNFRDLSLMKLDIRLEPASHPSRQIPLGNGAFFIVGRVHKRKVVPIDR